MIARIISFLILSIFMIYELAEIKIRGFKNYKNNYWNFNDVLIYISFTIYVILFYVDSKEMYAIKFI